MTMQGVLNVHKPVGCTSHDVVSRLRKMLNIKRIGHTGTLDPLVSGVLPVCIGRATRVVEYIQQLPKRYEVVLALGMATDTEDGSGEVIEQMDDVQVTEDEVQRAIRSFVGTIEQVPPMFSAVKVKGKRLYEWARQGIEVHRKAREVTIYSIAINALSLDRQHPEMTLTVDCSKGTYIRTLCVDIGKKLGVPAYMKRLVRTATGHFQLEDSYTFEALEHHLKAGTIGDLLVEVDQAIAHIPAYELDAHYVRYALQGRRCSLQHITPLSDASSLQIAPFYLDDDPLIRLYSPERSFLGLYRIRLQSDDLEPVKVFGHLAE